MKREKEEAKGNIPGVRTSTKEICLTALPVQNWTWSGRVLFRKNMGNGNNRMLVVPASRAVSTSPVCMYTKGKKWCRERRVLKEELRAFGIGWQRRPEKRWVSKSTGERASGTTATEISHDYGGRRSRRWSGRGSGMGASNAQTKKGRDYSIIIPSHLKVEVRYGTIYMLPWSRSRNLAHLHSF